MGGDLALAHALVEGKLDGLLLGDREGLDELEQGLADIGHDEVLLRVGGPGVGLLLDLIAKAVLCAAMALALAEAVDGAAAGQGDDPAQGLALGGVIPGGAVPDFHEDFLEEVLGLGLVVDDFHAEGFHDGGMAIVEVLEGDGVALLEHGHELLVGEVERRELGGFLDRVFESGVHSYFFRLRVGRCEEADVAKLTARVST